jgi:hypothetical protein
VHLLQDARARSNGSLKACVLDELETAIKPDLCIASCGFFLMALASLGLTDLPLVPTMMFGIVVALLVGVVAYENWRVMRLKYRSGYHGTGLTDAEPRHRPWREMSPWMRALRASLLICWAVALISVCTVGFIETVALRQPKTADAQFVHPHNIKGVMRFFTDRQESIYAVAKPLMFDFGAIFLALMVVFRHVEENLREQKMRDFLDRLTTEE